MWLLWRTQAQCNNTLNAEHYRTNIIFNGWLLSVPIISVFSCEGICIISLSPPSPLGPCQVLWECVYTCNPLSTWTYDGSSRLSKNVRLQEILHSTIGMWISMSTVQVDHIHVHLNIKSEHCGLACSGMCEGPLKLPQSVVGIPHNAILTALQKQLFDNLSELKQLHITICVQHWMTA